MGNNYDTIKLTDIKAEFSANYRLSTEYGTEEELREQGKSILNGGLPKMDALVITKESKKLVAGFSRFLALSIQPGSEEFEVPVRYESEKVNEAEKIRLNLASNIHRKPSMWSDAIALERLVKLGKEKKLAEFMPGTTPAYRSQLKTLVACDDSVRDAGANGQISPTLVLQLIAENNSRPLLRTDEKPKDGVKYRMPFNDLQAQIALDLEAANGAKLTAIDFAKLLGKASLPVHSFPPTGDVGKPGDAPTGDAGKPGDAPTGDAGKPGDAPTGDASHSGLPSQQLPIGAQAGSQAPVLKEGTDSHGDSFRAQVSVFTVAIESGIQAALGCKAKNDTVRVSLIIEHLKKLQTAINAFKGKNDI